MGYQIYKVGKRWGGYGVPAVCEQPECNEEIDRGMSFACGGEPFSEVGCDRYFCSKHRFSRGWNESNGTWCRHKNDCECRYVELCERCFKNKEPFPYKKETEEWVNHLLTDESWDQWREENTGEVRELESQHLNPPTTTGKKE